jgi:hypothetical protein
MSEGDDARELERDGSGVLWGQPTLFLAVLAAMRAEGTR